MANRRAGKKAKGQTARCKNPECGNEFEKKTSWQEYCSKKCRNHLWFLRMLGKKRSESVIRCPHCNEEFSVRVVPVRTKAKAALLTED